jgi:hypothetical protein
MIARARAVAHGSAYTTYATLKKNAEFVCCENMAGDMTAAVTDDDLDNIWMQFKYAGENYIAKGKPVTRNLIAMEVFEMMSVPGGYGYSTGGGGGNNDLPHKKKDEDEELLRAKLIAKTIARSCPRKVVNQSFHR